MLLKGLSTHDELFAAESEAVRMQAVKEVYERLLGRATQEVEHSGEVTIQLRSAFDDDSGGGAVQGDGETE
jgi:hypothetical protein